MGDILKKSGEILKFARESRKLSLTTAARKIGKSPSTLSRYEKGEIPVDLVTLYQLSAFYGIDLVKALPSASDKSESSANSMPEILYMRYFAGELNRDVFSVIKRETGGEDGEIVFYHDVEDVQKPACCRAIYRGEIREHNISTNIFITNIANSADQIYIALRPPIPGEGIQKGVLAGTLEAMGFLPMSTKCLVTTEKENLYLEESCTKFNETDVRRMKRTNRIIVKK